LAAGKKKNMDKNVTFNLSENKINCEEEVKVLQLILN